MTASTSQPHHDIVRDTQRLVLLGGGHAHVRLLAQLAAQPLLQTQVFLVSPHTNLLIPGMLPGFVAGHYALQNCSIPLEPLVQRSGVRWLERSAVAVNMVNQVLQLDDGSSLAFDWLSVNASPVQDRSTAEEKLPGAREHALFTRPAEAFAALWPRVVAMGQERPLRLAVIGTGTTAAELALAIRHRLPNAAVTLVRSPSPPGSGDASIVQSRLLALLKKRQVTVLQDSALSLRAGSVQLGCGADLACDVPVLVDPTQAPPWLANSGLALDAGGFPAVDIYQRSTSHSRVFSIHHGGSGLLHNLNAAMAGSALKAERKSATSLQLVSGGGRYAMGSWGSLRAQGHWVWWLKHWKDRRLMAQCQRPTV